jgi:predicted MPP superfamily phosphohydrolase
MTKCCWREAPAESGKWKAGIIRYLLLMRRVPLAVIAVIQLVSCTTAGNMFIVQPYNMESPKIDPQTTVKIVLIADLHNTVYGEGQSPLTETIKEISPDLILLAGDLMDEHTPPYGTELLLAGLEGIAPMYYATGNHEYMTKHIARMREIVQSFGIPILSDEYAVITIKGTEIVIAGIEDPAKKKYEDKKYNQELIMEQAFRALDEVSSYKILIAHRPERIKRYRNYSFDLIVSGHAHGGQWRIAHIAENGLYAPDQGLFPKYAGGLYQYGATAHVVSRGLSLTHPKRVARINNPPELVVIYLNGGGYSGF